MPSVHQHSATTTKWLREEVHFKKIIICDVVKQNESELTNINVKI